MEFTCGIVSSHQLHSSIVDYEYHLFTFITAKQQELDTNIWKTEQKLESLNDLALCFQNPFLQDTWPESNELLKVVTIRMILTCKEGPKDTTVEVVQEKTFYKPHITQFNEYMKDWEVKHALDIIFKAKAEREHKHAIEQKVCFVLEVV